MIGRNDLLFLDFAVGHGLDLYHEAGHPCYPEIFQWQMSRKGSTWYVVSCYILTDCSTIKWFSNGGQTRTSAFVDLNYIIGC